MKAILTKYVGPTNTRGSRIVVTDGDTRMLVNYDDGKRSEETHADAVVAFCERLGWSGELIQGGLKNGYVHVFTGRGARSEFTRVKEAGSGWSLAYGKTRSTGATCGRLTVTR